MAMERDDLAITEVHNGRGSLIVKMALSTCFLSACVNETRDGKNRENQLTRKDEQTNQNAESENGENGQTAESSEIHNGEREPPQRWKFPHKYA
jgi:hypothetical protein